MIKKMSVVEILLLMNFTVLIILAIIIGFMVNGSQTFELVSKSLQQGFGIFSRGSVATKCLLISIIVLISLSMGYWISNIILYKKITFGPMYVLLFFVVFLYTNGYYAFMFDVDAYGVILVMILIDLLATAGVCFVTYIMQIKKEELQLHEQNVHREIVS